MNSVFLEYGLSYFDLLQGKIANLFPGFTDYKMIISENGGVTESKILSNSNRALLTTNETLLSIGDRSAASHSEDLETIDIGFWNNGEVGYPGMSAHIYPHATFYHGINFDKTPVNYNPGSASLWANNSGNLILENKEVCSGSGVENNIALFDSRPGTLKDSGYGISSGSFTLTLTANSVPAEQYSFDVFFRYTKINDLVTLVVERKMFQGSQYEKPGSFFSFLVFNSRLPVFLRPLNIASCSINTYRQISTSNRTNLVAPPGLCTLDPDGSIFIYQNIDNGPNWDAGAGPNDGWATFSISYGTA